MLKHCFILFSIFIFNPLIDIAFTPSCTHELRHTILTNVDIDPSTYLMFQLLY